MLLKTFRQSRPFTAIPLALLIGGVLTTGANAEDKAYPEILKTIEQQGIRILGEMQVPGGLRAFAAKAGAQPLSEGAWTKLEAASWVQDGDPDAPRIVYSFTDPNCPYCNRFWLAARPWIESGKVQLRHVMVGVIRQDSPAKAAAILQARSPEDALTENERKHADGGITPLDTVDGDTAGKLERNAALMTELGFGGTPAIVFKTEAGKIDTFPGMPSEAQMEALLGPK
ncbi:thiol:disulfide interchange protein DsbG [Rhizobium paknamense]|uniref:Thiol:disulfide interchange protein n=1 Tax=Rhizobium paknamense TaxID=1206817 RepID=A0ABU0IGW5_9HYPH|nr:thiol:disulfide interchange protein DsbG [Rhizobium paknamense]MDQ0457469.1 thiol:disulfide interchange protein DsbG [Rhizobium paknamense]